MKQIIFAIFISIILSFLVCQPATSTKTTTNFPHCQAVQLQQLSING
jgi:hypothetical protein